MYSLQVLVNGVLPTNAPFGPPAYVQAVIAVVVCIIVIAVIVAVIVTALIIVRRKRRSTWYVI